MAAIAARAGQWPVVRKLLELYDADADEADSHGCTLLMAAVRAGQVDMVTLLLECAPNISAVISFTTPSRTPCFVLAVRRARNRAFDPDMCVLHRV